MSSQNGITAAELHENSKPNETSFPMFILRCPERDDAAPLSDRMMTA